MTALVEGVSLASVDLLIKDVVHLSTSFSKLLYSYTRRDGNSLPIVWPGMLSMLMEDVSPLSFSVFQVDLDRLSLV